MQFLQLHRDLFGKVMRQLINPTQHIVICLGLILALWWIWETPVQAQGITQLPIVAGPGGVQTPAWDQISFSSLPALERAGILNVPQDGSGNLDYILSRSWQAGASALDVLKLGDLQDAFDLGNFTLGNAVRWGGLNPTTLSLSNFEFLSGETVASLINRIPAIGQFKLGDVKPIYDLITQQGLAQFGNFQMWAGQPLSLLANLPDIGNLSLGSLDLSQYSFTQLPGLDQARLTNLPNWKDLTLAKIPGLGNVPFSAFFNPGQFLGFIAIHDVTYGGDTAHKESRWTPTKRSISGSYEVGFKHECAQAKGCDYIELNSPTSLGSAGDPTGLHGARWIRGGSGAGEQMVRGGYGILGMINNGQEPTGRHPFGKAFKVVLTGTDESTGTASFGLFFRACHQTAFIDLGCTPYFIGPIPWFPTREKGIVLVGMTELTPPSGIQEPNIPPEVQDLIDQYDPGSTLNNDSQICKIDKSKLDSLSRAILSSLPPDEMERATQYIPHIVQACGQAGVTDKNQLAYILATAQHESAHFNTTDEYSRTMYDSCGWGEGLIQVTWCDNKRRVFQRLNLPPYQGITDRRLHDPKIAAAALCQGMKEGWYRNLRIGQCIAGSRVDLACARDVVNGDYGKVGALINEKYKRFERVLQNASGSGTSASDAVNCSGSSAGTGQSTGKLRSPVAGAPVTSEFGMRRHPVRGDYRMHSGIDLGVPTGTPVKAADGGTVLYADWIEGYGNVMIVDHGKGTMTLYAHLDSFVAKKGQSVSAGQLIAKSGSTGVGTGPHLHFEVLEGTTPGNYRSGRAVNPRNYIKF